MTESTRVMGRGRVEAFSDGVLAIIITIMVLELKPPYESTLGALRALVPTFAAYVLSFTYVAIYWNNHHHLLHVAKRVTAGILWANMHLLFWLSLFPFATSWLSAVGGGPFPTAIYGGVLLCAGVAYFILQGRIVADLGPESALARELGRDWKGKGSVLAYAVAIGAAFIAPWLASLIYVLVAAAWLIPDRRVERAL